MTRCAHVSEELYGQIKSAAKKNNCSIEEQLEIWVRLGMLIEEQNSEDEVAALMIGSAKINF